MRRAVFVINQNSVPGPKAGMGDTQLAVLDHTIQLTNVWLKKMMAKHHFETRHDAYGALRAVLHALRDRLSRQSISALSCQSSFAASTMRAGASQKSLPATGRWTNSSYASPPSFRRSSRETRSARPGPSFSSSGRSSIPAKRPRSSTRCPPP